MSLATAFVLGALLGAPPEASPGTPGAILAIRYARFVAPLASAKFVGRGADAWERVHTIRSAGRDSGLVRPTFQSSLVGLHAPPCPRCSNRATASTFALIPRATVDLALARVWESGPHAAWLGARAVAGLDALRLDDDAGWPFEVGLGVTLAFVRRDDALHRP